MRPCTRCVLAPPELKLVLSQICCCFVCNLLLNVLKQSHCLNGIVQSEQRISVRRKSVSLLSSIGFQVRTFLSTHDSWVDKQTWLAGGTLWVYQPEQNRVMFHAIHYQINTHVYCFETEMSGISCIALFELISRLLWRLCRWYVFVYNVQLYHLIWVVLRISTCSYFYEHNISFIK